MLECLFPVEYKRDNPWDTQMIQAWVDSKFPYVTFAFNRFFPSTLPREPFWLYLYYTKSSTEDPQYKGKLRYRFKVIDWATDPFLRPDTYYFPSSLLSRVWFLCDRYQKVGRSAGGMLAYEDFVHLEGKNLGSSLRSSIAPVICQAEIKVIEQYP